ncbi:MAG: 3-isopropylmalate dehydrogenase [Spirochaetia bacterium]|jgi:3-isopropylmalate dehydrogenase|nr:3-isopropylmalate dehydrogenase [Spirochaetia bacterium]
MTQKNIAVLPGDGIGPEVMKEALKVLNAAAPLIDIQFNCTEANVGGAGIDNDGAALPATTLTLCKKSDAILFGSVGGPKWESLPPEQQPERAALLPLRKIFNLYANLRPAIIFDELKDASPLKPEIIGSGLDILIIRELTGGLYFGQPKGRENSGPDERAFDTLVYTRAEIERITRVAFDAARTREKKLTSIDKANVLTTMVLWRETVTDISKDYPDVSLNHMYVDNAAMQLVRDPRQFDVILADNTFGDILSDEASIITGSIGMLPSASLSSGSFGLYEPSGGSAPDIAGKGIANPIAQILSVAMMLKYSFGSGAAYDKIFDAIKAVLKEGFRTADIMSPGMKKVNTSEMGDLITERLKK